MSSVQHINDEAFDQNVLQSKLPVLVDFWAEWCAPCRAITPIIDQIAGEYEGKLSVAKVNVEEAAGVAAKYRVQQIPTLMIFKNGEVFAQHTGALSKTDLTSFVESNL